MTEWAISFYKLFHMSTSHVSRYSRTTKNSSDHLISQRTNTKPRDKQWPQNSHYSFLRNNMLTLKPCVQIGQWGSEVSTATTSCCKKKLLPVEVISQWELPVCGLQKHYFREDSYKHYLWTKPSLFSAMPEKQRAGVFAETSWKKKRKKKALCRVCGK